LHVSTELRNEICELNPLVDVFAEERFELEDAGGNIYRMKCFNKEHRDSEPSMVVYKDTQTFSCFGCSIADKKHGGVGSDVIAFIMYHKDLSFQEACEYLMNRADIPIPEDKVNPKIESLKKYKTDRNRDYYEELRKNPKIIRYLQNRGLTPASISKWRFGLVPDNVKWEEIRGRLAIGLHDLMLKQTSTIAMAYRTLSDDSPKYLNDPTSLIYNKTWYLFGLNFARQSIRKNKFAIVMEGYFDVILSHQVGLDMTVGTCGTSFTDEQMAMLRKYTNSIYLWYDSDKPGIEATLKHLPSLFKLGFKVDVVRTIGVKDPGELLIGMNLAEAKDYMIESSLPAMQFAINNYCVQLYDAIERGAPDNIVLQEKIRALRSLLDLLSCVQDQAERIAYADLINHKLNTAISIAI